MSMRSTEWIAAAAVAVAVGALAAGGARAADEPQRPCVKVDSNPPGVTVLFQGAGNTSGVTPVQFCSLRAGASYELTASRYGHERRTVHFSFDPTGKGSTHFSSLVPGALARSLVIPGWGQARMGHKGDGVVTFLFLAGAGFQAWKTYDDYDTTRKHYQSLLDSRDAATNTDTRAQLTEEADKARRDAEAFRKRAWLAGGAGVYLYAWNLAETYLAAVPPSTQTLGGGAFSIDVPERSRARAALRSALFPGMGQAYYGSPFKGILYRATFLTLGYFALDAKLHYDLATVDYDNALAAYRQAATTEEKQRLDPRVRATFDEQDRRRTRMYTYAIAAGAVWLANVADAVLLSPSHSSGRVQFRTEASASSFRTGLQVNFQ